MPDLISTLLLLFFDLIASFMLNLKIMMRTIMVLSFIYNLLIPVIYSQSTGIVLINSPRPDQPIQGTITILGNTRIADFAHAELIFTYHQEPEATGFLIYESTQPITDGPLTSWDTTSITDENYDLLLRVDLTNGGFKEDIVHNLKIRNDSLIQTRGQEEPLPAQQQFPSEISMVSPAEAQNIPTSLPDNPASFSINQFKGNLVRGSIIAAAGLLLSDAYLCVRHSIKQ